MNLMQKQMSELTEQFDTLLSSSENKIILDEYNVISSHLDDIEITLSSSYSERKNLENLPDGFSVNDLNNEEKEQYDIANTCVHDFSLKWHELDYEVRQGNTLDDMKLSLEKLVNLISVRNKSIWSSWVADLQTSFDIVDSVLETHENIPSFKSSIKSYRIKKNLFEESVKSIALDKKSIDEHIVLVEELRDLKESMDFDLPQDVKEFFKKISNIRFGTVVTLKDLTPDVIEWLTNNNALDNYVIKPKLGY